jgi:outer membrane protein TolC
MAAAFVAGGTLMTVLSAPAQDAKSERSKADAALAAEQLKIAEEALQTISLRQRDAAMTPTDDAVLIWNRRRAEAKVALAKSVREKADAIQEFTKRLEEIAAIEDRRFQDGLSTGLDVADARYAVLEARRWLEKETAQ